MPGRNRSGWTLIARSMAPEGRASDDWMRWLDSYEGLPSPIAPDETRDLGWRARGHHALASLAEHAPGVLLSGLLALAGVLVAERGIASAFDLESSPLSPILVAVLFGLAIRNAFGLPAAYDTGLRFSARRVLQAGVALLGIRLSLGSVGQIGLIALPVVVACVVAALVLVTRINSGLGLPRRLGLLIAVGTGICGNSAIVAAAPVIGAKEDEVSYAVACVTLFGLLALVTYPFLAHWLFAGDAREAGIFFGTAIHDTSQVAGAGIVYRQVFGSAEALDVAAVTKLLRNLFLLAVIPLLSVVWREPGRASVAPGNLRALVPGFVIVFLALTVVRSIGDLGDSAFGIVPREIFRSTVGLLSETSSLCLAMAMGAVGLGTRFDRLRGIGLGPFAVGISAAILVGGVSFAMIRLVVAPG